VADLRELYQSIILDHNRAPRNFGALADASAQARGHNPLCGDEVTVWVRMEGDRLADVRFVGSGCAISRASASLMTTVVRGCTVDVTRQIAQRFQALVTGQIDKEGDKGAPDPATGAALDRLSVLAGVRQFPIRVKCATLAWHALGSALDDAMQSSREGPTA
jgi:nitrogen fixation NifU-like protein